MTHEKKIFTAISIFIATVLVVAGFMVLGSPEYRRQVKMDRIRVSRLIRLERAINEYFQVNDELPKDLGALNAIATDTRLDPQTEILFPYQPISEREYRLCADFATEHNETHYRAWDHSNERKCRLLVVCSPNESCN